MKRRILLVLSFALLLAIVALPAAAQSWPTPGQGYTITELSNKTGDAAQVNITYYDQAGTPLAGPSPSIPGNGSKKIDPASSQLPAGYNGAAVVSSNKPLASVVNTRWEGGTGGDGFSADLYTGVSAGSTRICFPSLFKAPPNVYAFFTVQNTGTSAANITLTYFKRDGTNEGSFTDTIPVGAQHTYDMRTPSATVPNLASGWDGSAVVESTNGQPLAGVGVVPQTGRTNDYNASDCAGLSGPMTLVAPSQFRSGPSASTITLYSAINVQNLENAPANITLQYIPRTAGGPTITVPYTIPPLSAAGFNTRGGGSVPAATFNPLGNAWDGTVKIVSNKAVAATVLTQWTRGTSQEADYYTAANANGTATKFFMPGVRRMVSGSAWIEYSAVIVMNLGGSPASVTTKYYDRAGGLVHTFTDTIQPGAAVGYNTKSGSGGTAALGNAYEGHAVIESTNGQPLAVVLNGVISSPGGASGATNGVPQ